METPTITTNGHVRDLVSWDELPESVRGEFDYITDDTRWDLRFFQYRGSWFDSHEFERIVSRGRESVPFSFHADPNGPLVAWHAVQSQTVWDAIVIRWDNSGGEGVVVGHYVS